MRPIRLASVVALLASFAATASAQASPRPDDATMAAMMAAQTRRMQHPAEWTLEIKDELRLRPDQVEKLEKLVLAQRDSEVPRRQRMMLAMSGGGMSPGTLALAKASVEWTGAIDRKEIEAALCDQSKRSAESLVNMMVDRRAVGEILTEAQRFQYTDIANRPVMPRK